MRKASKIILTLGIVLLLPVIARGDKVTFDYDHSVNFYRYKTFMWIHKPSTEEPFMAERIVSALDTELRARGLTEVTEGADVALGANLATEKEHEWETYYAGSGWGWDGWATTKMKTYEVGTLTVDLFDGETKKLVWQGVATDEVSPRPAKQTREIDKQISKMFKYFPPAGHE